MTLCCRRWDGLSAIIGMVSAIDRKHCPLSIGTTVRLHRNPHARFVPLESRNHILLNTEPAWEQFVNEIDEFLSVSPDRSTAFAFDELTARERDVLELVAKGLSNIDISIRLKISEKTVRNHVSIIMSKLGAVSRAQAVAISRDAGFGRRTAP